MPRTRRGDVQGGLYHLYPRGVNRQRIFVDQRDRFFFLKSLVTACRLGDLGVVAYVLMTNHVPLVVRRGEKELGVGMKSLLGRYAQHFNRRHGRCGHLFQNRFGSSLCDTDSYLMHLIRYVHANPVRASLASNEAEYPHSSHHWYAQGRWPRWAAPVDVLDAFGSRQAACRFLERAIRSSTVVKSTLTETGRVRLRLPGWMCAAEGRTAGVRRCCRPAWGHPRCSCGSLPRHHRRSGQPVFEAVGED